MNNVRSRSTFAALTSPSACALGLLALIATAPAARAQEDKKPTYDVKVLGIRATNSNKEVSKELKSIAAALRKQFKYTGFKLVKQGGGKVEEGKSSETSLIDGYKVKVTPLSRTDKRVTLKLEGFRTEREKDVPKWKTTVTIDRGRYQLQHVSLEGGDGLIVAVAAT